MAFFQNQIQVQIMSINRITGIGGVFLLLLLFLISCGTGRDPVYVEGKVYTVDPVNISEKDKEVDSIIAIYRYDLEQEMSQVLAYSDQTMTRGTPEGLLNNFVADLVFEIGREIYQGEEPIDFCLLNYGGLRAPIPQGPVTMSHVFELMPFENEMVVITLSPEKILELFDYLAAANVGMPVSGIRLKLDDGAIQQVSIDGQEFNPERNYRVLTSDYLAGGGDNMTFFLEPLEYNYLGLRIRDAIIKYLQEKQQQGLSIKSRLDGRISD